jgi:hypothetical protein
MQNEFLFVFDKLDMLYFVGMLVVQGFCEPQDCGQFNNYLTPFG